MTIEQYLTGKVDYVLSSESIAAILFERGISEGAQMQAVTEKQRELALADLYMFLVNSSTSSSGGSESDGGWSKTNPCKNMSKSARSGLLSLARDLYAKWGESVPDAISKITSKHLY